MIFVISPMKTLIIQTILKKVLVIYALNPKNLYKLYKLYNAKQKIKKEYRKSFRNQIVKLLNYKYLLTIKTLIF
jgi:hypothetical protein